VKRSGLFLEASFSKELEGIKYMKDSRLASIVRLSAMTTFAASLTVPAAYTTKYSGWCYAANSVSYSITYSCNSGGRVMCTCQTTNPPQNCGIRYTCYNGGGGGS
jgi:hypothetical protein